jgi:NADH:ubiquinone oxidoreductase subunit E
MSKQIRVCCRRTCEPRGAKRVMYALEDFFGLKAGEKNDKIDLDYRSCTGYCEQGPNVVENSDKIYHGSSSSNIVERINNDEGKKLETIKPDKLEKILSDLF